MIYALSRWRGVGSARVVGSAGRHEHAGKNVPTHGGENAAAAPDVVVRAVDVFASGGDGLTLAVQVLQDAHPQL